jgi:phosphoglycolate phosphatase
MTTRSTTTEVNGKGNATDAAIFDIDGTLWNASAASAKGWNEGLRQLGIEGDVSAEDIAKVAGKPYEACVDGLLPGLRADYPNLLAVLAECERASVERDGGEFYRGALDAVEKLSHQQRIFLVSNCQDWYLELFLGFSGLRDLVSAVDCHGRSGLAKNEMLSRMKHIHSLSAPVYIGDTAGDETAAREAAMDYIHVSWGFGQPRDKPKVVDSFSELVSSLNC